MRKYLHLILVVSGITWIQNPVKAQSIEPKLAQELQHTLDSLTALFSNTKGVSAAVYAPGNGIWKGASGLSHAGTSATADMEFGIASNSKLFTAVVMLKLQEKKILSLDDSLHTWLPTYKNVNPNITVRQLLNHSSGVADPIFYAPLFDSIQANLNHVYTPDEVLTYLGTPLFAPGAGYGYSNVNYILAGMVAESATGYHISKLIRTYILTPLNMDSTFYDIEESERGTIAHRWFNGIDFHDSSRISLNTAGGAAGSIFSTSSEMVQWYDALLHGKIINQASINEMTAFSTLGNYGLGITTMSLFGYETWGHGGRTLGYKSRMFYDPCMQIVTSGLCNSDPSAIDGITALIHKVMLDRLPMCPTAITGTSPVCRGTSNETYIIHPIGRATSYEWTTPNGVSGTSTGNSITLFFGEQAVSGKITVRAVNDYGYGLPVEFEVKVEDIPVGVSISNNRILTVDSAGFGYQWLNCDSNYSEILGETGHTFNAKTTGNYAVQIQKNTCVDTSECIYVDLSSVDDLYENHISISPNPFTKSTFIKFSDGQIPTRLLLTNALGQTAMDIPIPLKDSNGFMLNRNDLKSGIYHLQLLYDNQLQISRKLMVE